MGDANQASVKPGATFGWPELLGTPYACTYTGLSKTRLLRAHRKGQLPAIGRCGRLLVFRLVDLQRFLRGEPPDPQLATITPISIARRPLPASLAKVRAAHGRDVDTDLGEVK